MLDCATYSYEHTKVLKLADDLHEEIAYIGPDTKWEHLHIYLGYIKSSSSTNTLINAKTKMT